MVPVMLVFFFIGFKGIVGNVLFPVSGYNQRVPAVFSFERNAKNSTLN